MPALTEVHFQNYRSFLDAKCRLSPVTVVIGANNAGKSNFLRGIRDFGHWHDYGKPHEEAQPWAHDRNAEGPTAFDFTNQDGETALLEWENGKWSGEKEFKVGQFWKNK